MQASCEFCEIFKNTFFTEHLRTTASDFKPVFSSTQFTLHAWSFYIRWIYISYDANSDCFGYDSQNENRTHEWIPIGFNNSGATLWKKRLQYRWVFCFLINRKFLRAPILKNITERLLLKIYSVLLFGILKGFSEETVCRRSTK